MTALVTETSVSTPPFSEVDTVTLRTVGVDIGSATSHLMFAEVVMARRSQELCSRYVVAERRVLWTSPVLLTPYSDGGETIDSGALRRFVADCLSEARVDPDSIDSGAVLLTGTALLRGNAAAIAGDLATLTGNFVCAAAGHHLEATLAAHGSGAVERSVTAGVPVLCLDVGGGTAKLALAEDGHVRATAAIAVGSRLVAWDGARRVVRLEPAAAAIATRAGVDLQLGRPISEAEAGRLASEMARIVVSTILGGGGSAFELTPAIPIPAGGYQIVLSGGSAEWLENPPADDPGDLGPQLAEAIMSELRQSGLDDRLRPAARRLRATVVGASQYATQVSGTTIHLTDPALVPVHGLPTVPLGDLADEPSDERAGAAVALALDTRAAGGPPLEKAALSLTWTGPPSWARLRRAAEGIRRGVEARPELRLVVLVVDADLSATFGRVLVSELGWRGPSLMCLDGLEIGDLDFLDIGRPSPNGGACPVVIKSLLFDRPDAGADVARRQYS